MSLRLWLPVALALALSPLLAGVINKTKALFAGRCGPPLLQLYFDLNKLLRKGAVYSATTTWIFRAGPVVSLSAVLICALMAPLGNCPAPLMFNGDMVAFIYLLALGRFFTVAAAMDTGSSFEGMGGSRETQFSALAEPALFLALAALARQAGTFSLSDMMPRITAAMWMQATPALCILVLVLFIVLLAENARIPVDDPNTHLELTMIHEVMVLDHGGPDLAFILYGAALKLWLFASLVVGVAVPVIFDSFWANLALALAGMFLCAVLVGVMESAMARLRLLRIPQLLVGTAVLAAVGFLLLVWG